MLCNSCGREGERCQEGDVLETSHVLTSLPPPGREKISPIFCPTGEAKGLPPTPKNADMPTEMEKKKELECTTRTLSLHVDNEPGVIDTDMIREATDRALPRMGLMGEAMKDLGYDVVDLEELRIEFKNIVRIDHLWMMANLTVLSLANNLIEKIENLDSLINLKILNLSFNKITKMENLHNLVNLVQLGLSRNSITVIEGLDELKQLEIFSAAQNQIEGDDCIMYLRKFRKIHCLNLTGNPCTLEEDFRLRIVTFVPQLIYYEYVRIRDEERERGKEKYGYELRQLNEEDRLIREEEEAAIRKSEWEAHLSRAFVLGLEGDHLYEAMFSDDPDGQNFKLIGEKVFDCYSHLKELTASASAGLFQYGMEKMHARDEEIRKFTTAVDQRQEKVAGEAREFTELLLDFKIALYNEARMIIEEPDEMVGIVDYGVERMNEMIDEMDHYCDETWICLVHKSVQLYELMDVDSVDYEDSMSVEMRGMFQRNMGGMVNEFIEKAQEAFTKIREAEADYFEMMSDKTNRYLTAFHMRGANFISLPEPLRPDIQSQNGGKLHVPFSVVPCFLFLWNMFRHLDAIFRLKRPSAETRSKRTRRRRRRKMAMVSKDALMNALGASHEVHLRVIDFTEDRVLTSCREWFQNIIDDLTREENVRNRSVIYELTSYLDNLRDIFREEIDEYLKEAQSLLEGEHLLVFMEKMQGTRRGSVEGEDPGALVDLIEGTSTLPDRDTSIKHKAKTLYPKPGQTEPYNFYTYS
ncbi:hypothetical protein AAG570_013744 [Ranatra chinensis]|uniref:Dynein axonemal assembly factor 1 homolog n=1 Tax=Ranatra chinensis TaxID=642074 RepID=A0ABD0YD39_9HEMI